jgi:dihydrofolate reductase
MGLSLDGYFEGRNHDISWHNVDDELHKFAIEQLEETDLFLWGRRIYQLMEPIWPQAAEDQTTSADMREIARLMNNTEKIVFSRTLESVSETKNWRNVKLVREFDPAEIQRLKERPGKDINVGGPNLALSFMKAGLIDELRFMIFPVVIDKGSTIFQGIEGRLNLELTKTRRFNSGNLLVCYEPAKGPNRSR